MPTKTNEGTTLRELDGDPVSSTGHRQLPHLKTTVRTWLPVLVPTIIVFVGAWTTRWVTEDAFINFRIIENFLSGHGPVFNVGERVEAYTDPLWVGLLSLFRWVFPFLTVEWWSIVLGLFFTVVGFLLGGRAAQRLAGNSRGLILPIGMLMVSVVDGVWNFATAGLEMGLVMGWLGLTWWLLVRAFERRSGSRLAGFVAGLGALIRPELALMALVYLVVLFVVVGSHEWQGRKSLFGRWIEPLVFAAALPVIYEIWRMAYFALLIPNTGLAKSAGASWWSQGFIYLKDFVLSDAIWLPLFFAMLVVVPTLWLWVRKGDRLRAAVLAAPLVAGIVNVLYVAHVGGDFMHARMLVPAFFSIGLSIWIEPRALLRGRSWLILPALGIAVWSIVCVAVLRYPAITQAAKSGIGNERAYWVADSHNPHPVNLSDFVLDGPYRTGSAAAVVARSISRGPKVAVQFGVTESAFRPLLPSDSLLNYKLIAPFADIGTSGLSAGTTTYVFDELSLANPIGSHTKVIVRGRPGHEKYIGSVWELARFGAPGIHAAPGISAPELAAARRAVSCNPLAAYLRAITSHLTFGRALSDIAHSISYTRMSFSEDPVIAARQLCKS